MAWPLAAQRLDPGIDFLAGQPLFTRTFGRLGGPPYGWAHGRFLNEGDQPVAGVLAVALLGTVLLGDDDDDAVARQPLPGEALQANADIVRQ